MGAPEGCKARGGLQAVQRSPRHAGEPAGGWWVVGRAGQNSSQGSHLPPTPQEEAAAIARAQHFLESSVALVSDPYVSALTTYALTLLRSPVFPAALRKLRSLAITQRRCPPPATPAATVPGPPTAGPRKQLMSTCIE